MYPQSNGDSSSDTARQVADSADAAMESVRATARDAMDGFSDTMQSVKDQAAATMERFRPQIDAVASYAKDEPTKALLIAAATGAGLMALVALMTRPSHTSTDTPSSRQLRQLAKETSDRLRSAANENASIWRKAVERSTGQWRQAATDAPGEATGRAESMMSSARGAAHDAYEGLAGTVEKWKGQAAPLVNRVRPQIDAVTGYAKDDPAKALLIAAAAGAALMGLMGTRNR